MARHARFVAKMGEVTPALGQFRTAQAAAQRTERDVKGAKRRREETETGLEAGRAGLAKKRTTAKDVEKRAEESKTIAAKKTFLALGPLDKGSTSLPKSLSDDREARERVERSY